MISGKEFLGRVKIERFLIFDNFNKLVSSKVEPNLSHMML